MSPYPEALREYRAFLDRTNDGNFDPYYSQEILRFAVRDEDVLVGPGDVAARPAPCGALMESARAGLSVTVCGIDAKGALACFAALDGTRTVSAARTAAGVAPDVFRVFLDGTFGKLVFAPLSLSELERRVSHAEI